MFAGPLRVTAIGPSHGPGRPATAATVPAVADSPAQTITVDGTSPGRTFDGGRLGCDVAVRKTAIVLTQITEDVLIHVSDFCQSNAVVVRGTTGVLLVDPGVHGYELAALADELVERGDTVGLGFSTHPHWDHLLWHDRFGSAPRYGTHRCSATARARVEDARDKAARIAEGVPLDLVGAITALPPGTAYIPWDGPRVRILEHQAHAPGHAALVIEDAGVLVAGDMLSDVEIPLLDLNDRPNPVKDYLDALRLLENVTSGVEVLVPGHGAVGQQHEEIRRRIDHDRAYVVALREGRDPIDSRVGRSATYGRDWLPGEHRRQLRYAAVREKRSP
jgi:glyoxylase-like metal-dependent hydrolase (beta-lactamase superfamily II)